MSSGNLSIIVRQLNAPTNDEVDRAVAILDAAFAERQFTKFLVGGDKSLIPLYHRASVKSAAVGGKLFVAGFSDTDIFGVATWFGPGQDSFGTEEQRDAGLVELFLKMPFDLRSWWHEYLAPTFGDFTKKVLGKGYKEAAWHLQILGVGPEHQRKGIATALIAVGEELVDHSLHATVTQASAHHGFLQAQKSSARIVLETTSPVDVSIYERRGFVLRG